MKRFTWFMLLGILMLVLAACGDDAGDTETESEGSASASGDTGKENWPDKFVFGVLPTEDQEQLSDRFEDMGTYLENELGIEVEIFVGQDYTALVEAMANGHIHGSGFGPFAYVLAHERAGAEAIAVGTEDADNLGYTAQFIALEESGIENLDDAEGKSMAYADPASASGHLFPKAMIINKKGLDMDTVDDYFGGVTFSGSHEASLLSVLNGDVDIAGVCSTCIARSLDGIDHPNEEQLKVVTESALIPNGPTTIQRDLPQDLKDAFKQAILTMKDDELGMAFLESNKWSDGFVEVSDEDYQVVRDTADALGLNPEDLLN
ncbi:phosphate/phosphite/phosphonate ABC transporter substrate-binding protein [Planococcus sp. ISL-109]|uniref:phosphate/phosphite/phosphonate ABC transporter substrate-binding protein n=1 Tax=Planococcus sp. ISL-109 TaxID=2819166 RepID=UPI001BE62699|nr:phosphate/phosphite/phosphonate ABC transporter substrate-binding protein [Planococcus sp. ISL-109]MBT2582229.1 phosphate/phosphite/phosphonate ABC transporter substrate-binding protein [Planococcus sp. ISL-109]